MINKRRQKCFSVILVILFVQTFTTAQNSSETSLSTNSSPKGISTADILKIGSDIVGWIYFLAWSISFYPQIMQNHRRKSVRGLSLDFVYLNLTGFIVYSIYNAGLYWFSSIKQEYHIEYPKGVIPVQLNDVVFSLHALFACTIVVIQCIIYDRGSQTVTITGQILLYTFFVFITILFILAATQTISWLGFLTSCSYVKLVITLIKYMPQAYLNFRRKSTSGWCIGNVLLDFTGGIFSLTQMVMIAYIHSDWSSFFGDLTKCGLGLFSILFDIIFMVQHYILYRNSAECVINTLTVKKPKKDIEMVDANIDMSIHSR